MSRRFLNQFPTHRPLPPPTEVRPMRIICSWCQTLMSDGTLPASHSLCPTCKAKLDAELDALGAAR